jgi:hypothetical protein
MVQHVIFCFRAQKASWPTSTRGVRERHVKIAPTDAVVVQLPDSICVTCAARSVSPNGLLIASPHFVARLRGIQATHMR